MPGGFSVWTRIRRFSKNPALALRGWEPRGHSGPQEKWELSCFSRDQLVFRTGQSCVIVGERWEENRTTLLSKGMRNAPETCLSLARCWSGSVFSIRLLRAVRWLPARSLRPSRWSPDTVPGRPAVVVRDAGRRAGKPVVNDRRTFDIHSGWNAPGSGPWCSRYQRHFTGAGSAPARSRSVSRKTNGTADISVWNSGRTAGSFAR